MAAIALRTARVPALGFRAESVVCLTRARFSAIGFRRRGKTDRPAGHGIRHLARIRRMFDSAPNVGESIRRPSYAKGAAGAFRYLENGYR